MLLTPALHSFLALSGLEIAIIVCIIALSVALITVSIIVAVVGTKKRKNAQPVQVEKKPPIIIYRRVPVERVVVVQPAPQPAVQPQPEYDEEAEEEMVPTVDTEIAAANASEQHIVVEDDTANSMRYNKSFRARLIQTDDQNKEWYGILKNEILSYNKVSNRISWKHESFSYRRNAVAKMFIKGKTLCLYLPLNAKDYAESKYKLEDVSDISQFADTPSLYRIKSERRVKYAIELITEICEKLGSKKTEREPVDYYEPYSGTMALINKGLIKRVIEDANTSFIGASSFNAAQDEATVLDEDKK